ncbi:polyprenyl synthetase family protein [Streptomyces iconiensis]|uniref:Polyprenyl synthetase family protein n=1 Tax=Streptomyces iconiensis TaxID=1384038 RepID=A0ABT7A6S9_9ACTN|nr:polyprenyl synthetase family protein [Streptomyces iconiensis]MDJ1137032.1 polyprenyl synthetase family protein [Streptomyces iconiensis]
MSTPTSPLLEPAAPSAPAILDRCRELVRPALVEAIGELHPWTGEMAAFALGWRDTTGVPASDASEGKGVRQALAVLGAEAAGADGEAATAGAVAVELIHTFSLLHDDVMDGDGTRRRRETVWKAYGTGPAVLAGDALFALAMQTLAEACPTRPAALPRLCATLTELVRGQTEDLLFESRPWTGPNAVRPDEYRAMAERKTGALLGCAGALGALLGGAPPATVTALDQAGRHLGVAFQAIDDLLSLQGDPTRTGKPVHSDLQNGKKTYPVLSALAKGDHTSQELAQLLNSPTPLDHAALTQAATLIEETGGTTATRTEATHHLTAAHTHLHTTPLTPQATRDLTTLTTHLHHRTT